ncbi:MAG TPA: iron-containing redox enzyme family protein [Candidatus Cybelea sp.]|nr:iron-containing redox enzyme family protein [Candidatus Cybelea sp.]
MPEPIIAGAPDRSAALLLHLDLISRMLDQAGRRLMQRESELDALILDHLIVLHQMTRASLPLMEAALHRAQSLAPDPVAQALIGYFEEHIAEERDHDLWTLEDLEAGGVSRAEVIAAIPGPEVAALAGAQYFWLLHDHPVALLGYIAVLEATAPSPAMVQHWMAASRLPAAVFRTHHLHAALDPGHVAKLIEFINRTPLGPRHERLIVTSAIHTGQKLAELLVSRERWILR